ncbi:hypothetical protein L5515_005051 [Caenorhabditis briggsae]|uniref:Uncharacterized protein n=1 Tax=Caenorhabditis briggsae TaxID=6238 RepID=A0AAE9JDN8_CAEBR|nr:hypothetical protein L5515_005051 [Caenorhabditis briggsae]
MFGYPDEMPLDVLKQMNYELETTRQNTPLGSVIPLIQPVNLAISPLISMFNGTESIPTRKATKRNKIWRFS